MYIVPADGSPGWERRMRSFQSQSGLRPIRSDGRPAGPEKHGACDMTSPPSPKPTVRNHEFYLARMNACQAEASETLLPNVRDRALRAAAAWQEMYNKAQPLARKSVVEGKGGSVRVEHGGC